MRNQKGFAHIIIVLIIISLLVLLVYWVYKNNNGEVVDKMPIPLLLTVTPRPSSFVAATADPTANWKTYTNTKYGFSFKYPTTWKTDLQTISDSDKEYRFLTDKNEFINLTVMNGIADTSNDKAWLKNINVNSGSYLIISYTDDLGPGSKGGVKDIKVFDQVLSTFKFGNQIVDSSNWKTYTSDKYNFSFKYFESWSIESPDPSGNFETSGELNMYAIPSGPVSFTLNVIPIQGTTLETQLESINNYQWKDFSKTVVNVDGVEATLFSGQLNGKLARIAMFSKGKYIYKFNTVVYDDLENLNQILSTFKFTK